MRDDLNGLDATLEGVTTDFIDRRRCNLLDRWTPHHEWLESRSQNRVDPYSKYTSSQIGPEINACDRWGRPLNGVNFASQDYLNLASHPAIRQAAKRAVDLYGVHSAGSAALMGNTVVSVELEQQMAQFLSVADCTVFPSGWGAGYGTIKTLVGPNDHIIIDTLAHACLQEGARNATANVHAFPHLSFHAVERVLLRIRRKEPQAGILVATETVFSMDSDVPDITQLQEICRASDATLMVDVAHDLGCIGVDGRGYLGIQDMVGKVDLVMGSFSKTFASNGGFVATQHPALKLALRYNCGPLTFTNALSPIQASVVSACLKVIQSDEGRVRRERLMDNILYMRQRLVENGFQVLGQPSAIIPVMLGGNALSRLMTCFALEGGAIVNLVEYPAVAKRRCRWRIQMMTEHTKAHIDHLVQTAVEAREKATDHLRSLRYDDRADVDYSQS